MTNEKPAKSKTDFLLSTDERVVELLEWLNTDGYNQWTVSLDDLPELIRERVKYMALNRLEMWIMDEAKQNEAAMFHSKGHMVIIGGALVIDTHLRLSEVVRDFYYTIRQNPRYLLMGLQYDRPSETWLYVTPNIDTYAPYRTPEGKPAWSKDELEEKTKEEAND